MYAIIVCDGCKKKRIIDLNEKTSKCPYCGDRCENKDRKPLFKSEDQAMVRAAFNQVTGFVPPKKEKAATEDADPYSTLEYRYEHCHSLEEKMAVLSEGLTKVFGEFTFEDLEGIEHKNAEKMLKAMLVNGYVHETKYGRYTA